MRRHTIVELLAELRSLDRKCKVLGAVVKQALDDYGTCLTHIDGIISAGGGSWYWKPLRNLKPGH